MRHNLFHAVAGKSDAFQVVVFAKLIHQLIAISIGQPDVRGQKIEFLPAGNFARAGGRIDGEYFIIPACKQLGQYRAGDFVILESGAGTGLKILAAFSLAKSIFSLVFISLVKGSSIVKTAP
jgi:hypothetical protein